MLWRDTEDFQLLRFGKQNGFNVWMVDARCRCV